MSQTVYFNGEYVAADQARVSVFDRGFLFGDGVYEGIGVMDGKILDFDPHMARLERSLQELMIPQPLTRREIITACRELIARNNIGDGLIYMQITRGQTTDGNAERDFLFASASTPTVFMFIQEKNAMASEREQTGVTLHSVLDIRWARCDIKSNNLLGQVLGKHAAREAGADECLMIDSDGFVTECGSSSFCYYKDNHIVTRPLSHAILPGVTRKAIMELCTANQIELKEHKFTLDDVLTADEAFITGASIHVLPVTQVDQTAIGTGQPGPITMQLCQFYRRHARQTAL